MVDGAMTSPSVGGIVSLSGAPRSGGVGERESNEPVSVERDGVVRAKEVVAGNRSPSWPRVKVVRDYLIGRSGDERARGRFVPVCACFGRQKGRN